MGPGERIGLVGVNGSGKTTLLRTLAGEAPLEQGRRVEGKTVRLGWLRQELDDLDPTKRLIEAVQDVASYVTFGDKEISASQLAERLGFSAKRQRTPIGDLSGGEKRRLQLTRVLMAEPNVLLLDEPTNDLDIDTLQELESLLDEWPGTLVVISHDRYLIERICDSTWALFGDGQLTNLPGGIEQYLERRKREASDEGRRNTLSFDDAGSGAVSSGRPSLGAKEVHALTKEMSALERKMAKVEAKINSIHEKMNDVAEKAATGEPVTDELAALDKDLKANQDEHDELEMKWLEIGEKLEDN